MTEIDRRWRPLLDTARLIAPSPGRFVVVAPHPDDEVLTVGGLTARLTRAGSEVVVVSVTDGGNAYPHRFAHEELAAARRAEQRTATTELGVRSRDVVSVGMIDGSVAGCEDLLVERLRPLCTSATTIVAPWEHDHHSDHEATGRAARRVAVLEGCTSWSWLFWAWHHAAADTFDNLDLVRVDLDDDVREIKERALQCHATQLRPDGTEPILTDELLSPARWRSEYFVHRPPTRDRS